MNNDAWDAQFEAAPHWSSPSSKPITPLTWIQGYAWYEDPNPYPTFNFPSLSVDRIIDTHMAQKDIWFQHFDRSSRDLQCLPNGHHHL